MGVQYIVCQFVTTILILQARVSSAELYHIVPNNSTDLCHNYLNGTCFTIEAFPYHQGAYSHNKVTLNFLPGLHLMRETLSLSQITDLKLTGRHVTSDRSSPVIIRCEHTSGFYLHNIQLLSIESLTLTGCLSNTSNGGAAYISTVTSLSITKCIFISNRVSGNDTYGGALYVKDISELYIRDTSFVENHAKGGGAIFVTDVETFSIENSTFDSNTAWYGGGAIGFHVHSLKIIIVDVTRTRFLSNVVTTLRTGFGIGGAVSAYRCHLKDFHNSYINNGADIGGAIYADNTVLNTSNSQYVGNRATSGGAIYANSGFVASSSNNYTSNVAITGGAIVAESNVTITDDRYLMNEASEGGAIYHTIHNMYLNNSNFTGNRANITGVIHLSSTSLECHDGLTLLNNYGSLYLYNSQLYIYGSAYFVDNDGVSGGAINSIQSQIYFESSHIHMWNNSAAFGGGILLAQGSTLNMYSAIELIGNRASSSGGGIYAYHSQINIVMQRTFDRVLLSGNEASKSGGGIYAEATSIMMCNSLVLFDSNRANRQGGAMFLADNSIINLKKEQAENSLRILPMKLVFNGNSAVEGGAIFVQDNTNTGILCGGSQNTSQVSVASECFLQTLKIYTNDFSHTVDSINFINTFFKNNSASLSGKDIYGGLLDRCSINRFAELVVSYPQFSTSSGDEYFKATMQFDDLEVYQLLSYPYSPNQLIKTMSRYDMMGLISSDAVQVCFCVNGEINCTNSQFEHSARKGEAFQVGVIAIDQVGNPVNSGVISTTSNNARLKTGQAYQKTRTDCTILEYNTYSSENSTSIVIYPDGPCKDMGVSKRTIDVIFLPCTCPVGFEPSQSRVECVCQCDIRLKPYVKNCTIENGSNLLVSENVWIGFVNKSKNIGFIIHPSCPFDYCTPKPINIDLNISGGVDMQCAFNRSGILCGACRNNLSLVFGSSNCKQCSNFTIFLLVPFALAGIALVAIVIILNVTVATGTIHGLILYANLLSENSYAFLPFETPNFLTTFVSWLNLDLGIETCFYHGMTSYGKFLLKLVFPSYLFLLIIIIIVLCERSRRFAALLSKRNPVATLCTLILLSYSKLFQVIIAALQYTYIDYPDGSRDIVWLYDANVPYFSVSHIPRFIAAFIIIILGVAYTTLLCFGQCFTRCSSTKIMKWTKNTKYYAFVDAYHAPFHPKHRYWVGLLLFIRIISDLVSSFTSDSKSTAVFTVCIIVAGLLLLKLLANAIYSKRFIGTIETTFLMNLLVLSITTFYVMDSRNKQCAVAIISMTVSFITFLGILVYHFYQYILKDTEPFIKLRTKNKRSKHHGADGEEEPLLNQQPGDQDDQLREDLDIFDPVCTEDYRQPIISPTDHKSSCITFTVIDGKPGHNNVPLVNPVKANV